MSKKSHRAVIAFFVSTAVLLTGFSPAVFQSQALAEEAPGTPQISSVTPASGQAGGKVRILGSGFVDVSSVRFGNLEALEPQMISSNEIEVLAPSGFGLTDLRVETKTGIGTASGAFLFANPERKPTVTKVNPLVVPLSGHKPVTIWGSGFESVTGVNFGVYPAVSFRVISDSKLTAIAPALATPETQVIAVTGAAGTSSSSVSLTWNKDCSSKPIAEVKFKSNSSLLSTSAKQKLRLQARQLALQECPAVGIEHYKENLVSSSSNTARQYISLSKLRAIAVKNYLGLRLEKLGSTAQIKLVPYENQISQSSRKKLDTFEPYRFLKVSGSVTNQPYVSKHYPAVGSSLGGTRISFYGENLDRVTGVRFGSTAATDVTLISSQQLVVIAPAKPVGSRKITLEFGTSKIVFEKAFRFVGAPKITKLSSELSGLAGSRKITITGSNLANVTNLNSVTFGGIPARSLEVKSDSLLEVTVPPRSGGKTTLSVATSGGVATKGFQYLVSPKITSVSPSSGVSGGGTSVVIEGSDFSNLFGPNAVRFGSTPASSYLRESETKLTAVTAPATAGVRSVAVTGFGGIATLKNAFTYGGSISPATQVLRATKGAAIDTTPGYSTNYGFTGTVTYAISGGILPSGLLFDTSTGRLSGTPTQNLIPTVFTVTATGSTAGLAIATITLSVVELTPVNQEVSLQIDQPMTPTSAISAVSGFSGNLSFSLVSGTLPPGLSLNSTNGTISGTPTQLSPTTTYRIRVLGSTSGSGQVTVTIMVVNPSS